MLSWLQSKLGGHMHGFDYAEHAIRTADIHSTVLACALKHQAAFMAEGDQRWLDMLLGQTECALVPIESFRQTMARYLLTAQKNTAA